MWAELEYDKAGIVRNHHIYGESECDTTTGYCRLDSEKFTLMYFINSDTTGINHVYNILPLFELTPKKFHISAGETVPEQVHCCMRVLQEFQACSVEVDGVQLLRTKFLGNFGHRDGQVDQLGPVQTSLAAKVWICSWSSRRWWICRCKTPFVCRFREACGL